MKGTIFVEFLGHVEAKYGLEVVDQIIEDLDGRLTTGGAYTTVGLYPHEELLALAVALCSATHKQLPSILSDFADHIMAVFQTMHPDYFAKPHDIFDFLMSVEHVIHVDVEKLYPEARTPLVHGELGTDGCLTLKYTSHRPLAQLALALAETSGRIFRQPLEVEVLERGADDRSLTMKLRRRP